MKAIDAAEWFLSKEPMTHGRLQCLLYLAYKEYLYGWNGDIDEIKNILFDEKPYAWWYGPTFQSVFQKYSDYHFQDKKIPKIEKAPSLPIPLDYMFSKVWEKTCNCTDDSLAYAVAQEAPYRVARHKDPETPMDDKSIYLYAETTSLFDDGFFDDEATYYDGGMIVRIYNVRITDVFEPKRQGGSSY